MDITPLIKEDHKIIQSYGAGRFKVSDELYESAIIIFPENIFVWRPSAELVKGDFKLLLEKASELDVVLLGTGKAFQPISQELRGQLSAGGLNVDAMDTGAACRTYSVLMAEGRRVAAALLPV